jgi:hypothetical protein
MEFQLTPLGPISALGSLIKAPSIRLFWPRACGCGAAPSTPIPDIAAAGEKGLTSDVATLVRILRRHYPQFMETLK